MKVLKVICWIPRVFQFSWMGQSVYHKSLKQIALRCEIRLTGQLSIVFCSFIIFLSLSILVLLYQRKKNKWLNRGQNNWGLEPIIFTFGQVLSEECLISETAISKFSTYIGPVWQSLFCTDQWNLLLKNSQCPVKYYF